MTYIAFGNLDIIEKNFDKKNTKPSSNKRKKKIEIWDRIIENWKDED